MFVKKSEIYDLELERDSGVGKFECYKHDDSMVNLLPPMYTHFNNAWMTISTVTGPSVQPEAQNLT